MKWWLLFAAAGLTTGCAMFNRAPLPKNPASEATGGALPAEEKWAAALRKADVIYFSLTKSAPADEQSAWPIIDALQRGGGRLALGWAELSAQQQPLLDQWQRQEISAAQLLDQLPARESGELMRRALRPDLGQVALGGAPELLAKIRAGEALTEQERASVPHGFRARPEIFENFLDRLTTSPRLRRYNANRLYRAHLVAEETVAGNIVAFMRANPNTKLLVFLLDDLMTNPREIAQFTAQKLPLRQMIFDRVHRPPNEQRRLLAWNTPIPGGANGGHFWSQYASRRQAKSPLAPQTSMRLASASVVAAASPGMMVCDMRFWSPTYFCWLNKWFSRRHVACRSSCNFRCTI